MGSANTNTALAGARRVVNYRAWVFVAIQLAITFLYNPYIYVTTQLLTRLEFWTAHMIVLLIVNPIFLVIWRILLYYRTIYSEDAIVDSPANGDIASKIPLEKTSTLV